VLKALMELDFQGRSDIHYRRAKTENKNPGSGVSCPFGVHEAEPTITKVLLEQQT
jgi:hypothetical protein